MKVQIKKKNVRPGAALIIAMIFIVLFSMMAVMIFTTSSNNAQAAGNYRQANRALESAQSGLEIMRYLFEGISIQNSVPAADRVHEVYSKLSAKLSSAGMQNLSFAYDSQTKTIQLSAVTLDSSLGKDFGCTIKQNPTDAQKLMADITGQCKNIRRTIRAGFAFDETAHTVFDFGIATRGPLLMTGQSSIDGVNLDVESDVYIEAQTGGNAFEISSQASVGGNVHIVDPYAGYLVGSKASIGGETGEAAKNHIELGVDPVDFPVPNVEHFRQFATGEVITSDTGDIGNRAVLENIIISANTNPTFASNITINGVLFIEQPNVVHFSGKATVRGIIVGVSEPGYSSGNSLQFSGQVECYSVSELSGAQFNAIKQETGTFIMAPGFSADFTGQANVLNGAIAVSGIRFTGQAGGQIKGSIINYSPQETVLLQGQSKLMFNRMDITEVPAGFEPRLVLAYSADDYSEVAI